MVPSEGFDRRSPGQVSRRPAPPCPRALQVYKGIDQSTGGVVAIKAISLEGMDPVRGDLWCRSSSAFPACPCPEASVLFSSRTRPRRHPCRRRGARLVAAPSPATLLTPLLAVCPSRPGWPCRRPQENLQNITAEIDLLRALNHRNIVQYLGACKARPRRRPSSSPPFCPPPPDPQPERPLTPQTVPLRLHPRLPAPAQRPQTKGHLYIVMEYMENGSLSAIIKPNRFGAFPESLVAVYIGQARPSPCLTLSLRRRHRPPRRRRRGAPPPKRTSCITPPVDRRYWRDWRTSTRRG